MCLPNTRLRTVPQQGESEQAHHIHTIETPDFDQLENDYEYGNIR
jgi:hypothetical protein